MCYEAREREPVALGGVWLVFTSLGMQDWEGKEGREDVFASFPFQSRMMAHSRYTHKSAWMEIG